jgi:hypothetical protein
MIDVVSIAIGTLHIQGSRCVIIPFLTRPSVFQCNLWFGVSMFSVRVCSSGLTINARRLPGLSANELEIMHSGAPSESSGLKGPGDWDLFCLKIIVKIGKYQSIKWNFTHSCVWFKVF